MWNEISNKKVFHDKKNNKTTFLQLILTKSLLPVTLITFMVLFLNIHFLGLINTPIQLKNPGFYLDAMAVILLASIHALISIATYFNKCFKYLRYGLLVWLMGELFDFADEFVDQPRWVGYYCEDLLRLSGMLIVFLAVLGIFRHMGIEYSHVRYEAMSDELTKLPNRRFFMQTLRNLEGEIYTLFMIDIDHFKKINDTWGHETGDHILQLFGSMLSNHHSSYSLPARIGGEEFAVVVRTASVSQSDMIAMKILNRARKILVNSETMLSVSIGVGVRKKGEPPNLLMKRVDQSLYLAKQGGRNRVVWSQ